MYKYAALFVLLASALAVPAPESNLDCLQNEDDIFSCVAVKMVSAIDRAARSADVHIIDGITFVKDGPVERSGKSLKSETEILSELPSDAADRTLEIAGMLYESAANFFQSHSLKVNAPEGGLSRALTEARAKGIKKVALPIVAAIGVKLLALAPIVIGGVILTVLKAVIVSKVALLIAGILAFQRFFSGNGAPTPFVGGFPTIFSKNQATTGWADTGAWSGSAVAGNPQGYNYRSFQEKDAQNLAYSAHAPSETN